MRILFVGGGTGGHFYPLIAIAEAIKEADNGTAELLYMGPNAYDQAELDRLNISFVRCPAGKSRRYGSILNFLDVFKTLWGVFVAITKLFVIYPDVVMSKGGYTSVPVILAAAFLRIPIVIHESDAVPGRANKIAARFARYIAISYDEVAPYFPENKIALTGIPIRKVFLQAPENPHQTLGIPADKPLLVVTGGSSGAERINTLILDSLDELLPNFTLLHIVGKNNLVAVQETAKARGLDPALLKHYFVVDSLSGEKMSAALYAAHLAIARAGSTTIFELALTGTPAILIPIPQNISHDQRTNAYAYARTGAASVIEEHNLTDGLLAAEVTRIMQESGVHQTMYEAAVKFTTPHAAATLATTLQGIALEH